MHGEVDRLRLPIAPPFIFLGFMMMALVLNLLVPLPAQPFAVFRIIGGVVLLGGSLLGGQAVLRMRRLHTSPDPHMPPAALVTDGPYRWSRNPIYLGFILIVAGSTLLAGTLWGIVLIPLLLAAATRLVVRAEERYLSLRFPRHYDEYRQRVRRWI